MAGGMGTRLRSITGDTPKPMVPLLGRPMMEHIIILLREQGFTDICAAVRYRAGDIMGYFGDGSRFGVRLQYRVEDRALGTAGGVKNCRDFYGDEDFLVISGDAACDFELRTLMDAHRRSGADATIALYRSREPLRYGLAVTDHDGLVRSFIEKPDWRRVVTDLVNTGIYVLSPRVMELVNNEGMTPVAAYWRYMSEQAQQQIEIEKKNNQNRQMSPGSVGGSEGDTSDPFLRGLLGLGL